MALAVAYAKTAAVRMLIMPTYKKLEGKHMKWIEFVLLAVGAIIGASLRYKLVESPVAVYGLPVNVLISKCLRQFHFGLVLGFIDWVEFGSAVYFACGSWFLWILHHYVFFRIGNQQSC